MGRKFRTGRRKDDSTYRFPVSGKGKGEYKPKELTIRRLISHAEPKLPDEIEALILKQAKEEGNVVYGAQAMNIQIPEHLRRETSNYDIYSRTPKASAERLCTTLNERFGGGFYVKEALHKGTWKVSHVGLDKKLKTKDDVQIVDETKMPKGIRSVIIGEVRFHKLADMSRERKEVVLKKGAEFRQEKDLADIGRMEVARSKSVGKKKKKERFFDPDPWL